MIKIRLIRNLFLLFFIISILVGGYLVFNSKLENIEIEGNTYYNDEGLVNRLRQIVDTDRTLLFFTKLSYDTKLNIPFIDELEVTIKNLNTIKITVYEKEVVACFPYMGEFVCFDKDGFMVGSIEKKRDKIPVVTGIAYKRAVFNHKIEIDKQDVFEIILNLTQLIKKYDISVERIDFSEDLSVRLFTGEVIVDLGKRKHFDEQISNLVYILPKLSGERGILHMEEYSVSKPRVVFEKIESLDRYK